MSKMQTFHDALFSKKTPRDNFNRRLLSLTRQSLRRIMASVEEALFWSDWRVA